MKFVIITDYRGWLWETFPNWEKATSLNLGLIIKYLSSNGHDVIVTSYADFDFSIDYSEYYVVYTSSEDFCGLTKDYMEDVLLWLAHNGAKLLPNIYYFRAHHNKVMMELLRKTFKNEKLKNINAVVFRAKEEVENRDFNFPLVLKAASGSGSKGVYLINNKETLIKKVKNISRTYSIKDFFLIPFINLRRDLKKLAGHYSRYNKKFIIQDFIPNLGGDYKVLIFSNKYFVLHRANRPNDFRASGSGLFSDIEPKIVNSLLSFAKICKDEISSPFLSLDVGFDGNNFYLLEFQCVSFGFKAMSMSEFHYEENKGEFIKVDGKVVPEDMFCEAILSYIK